MQVPINRALNGKLPPDLRDIIKQDFRKDVRGYNRVAVLATQHLQMNLKARLEAGNCPTRYSAKLPDGRFDMENGLNIEYYIKAHYHDNFGKNENLKRLYAVEEQFRQLPEKYPEIEINASETFSTRFVAIMLKQYKTLFQTNITTNTYPRTRRYLQSHQAKKYNIGRSKRQKILAKDIFMFMEEMDGDFESHTDGHEIDEVKRKKMQEWLEEVGCEDHVRYFGDCKKSNTECFSKYIPFLYNILKYFNRQNEKGLRLIPLYKHGMPHVQCDSEALQNRFYKTVKKQFPEEFPKGQASDEKHQKLWGLVFNSVKLQKVS